VKVQERLLHSLGTIATTRATHLSEAEVSSPTVAVAVVCICGAEHLHRCLTALREQEGAAPFKIVVRHDPALTGLEAVARRHHGVEIGWNPDVRTPLELAAAALRACAADVLLLTEDHCIPSRTWVRSMVAARRHDRAAVGGRVEIRPGASAVNWAFYFVDFFRYASPVREGPSPTLTVCNVAYDRERLEAVREVWSKRFEEPAVHDALRARFGALWLTPDSEVAMRRTVSFGKAVRERYSFGRIFGHTRGERLSSGRRLLYAILAPALPMLLIGRMSGKALQSPRLARSFLRGLPPLIVMVLAWSLGEWLGYVTGRPPRSLVLAEEARPADSSRESSDHR
jgi:hypothetical protein